jgi:hypothetical protein
VYAGDNATTTSGVPITVSHAFEGVKLALAELLSRHGLPATGLTDSAPISAFGHSPQDSTSRMSIENSQSPPRGHPFIAERPIAAPIGLPAHFPTYPPSGPWNLPHHPAR